MHKRDAIVLIVICCVVVVCAGATRGSKLLMCTTNLKKIGEAMPMYCDSYDGKMPTVSGGNYIRSHYVCATYDTTTGQVWTMLGCLFKAGLVPDGRTFYCPSTRGWMDEYLAFSNPAPWGSNLDKQAPNPPGFGIIWLRITKGYIYWPQSTTMVTGSGSNLYGVGGVLLDSGGSSGASLRYKVGQPAPPYLASQLDSGRALVADCEGQKDDSTRYNVNTLFPDGHTRYQLVPQYNGKWICPYQVHRPADSVASEWYGDGTMWDNIAMMSNYMYLLQP
jgi:hypothetical protein